MKLTRSLCPVTGRRITLRTVTPIEHETARAPLCADGTQAEPYISISPTINYDNSWRHTSHRPHTHAAASEAPVPDTFFAPEPAPPTHATIKSPLLRQLLHIPANLKSET